MAQAAGVANVCEVHAHYSGGGTFARLLARPGPLLDKLRAIPQLDILVVDLGTNDLCPEDAAVSSVVGEALELLELLRRHHLLPQQVVFLTVVLRSPGDDVQPPGKGFQRAVGDQSQIAGVCRCLQSGAAEIATVPLP